MAGFIKPLTDLIKPCDGLQPYATAALDSWMSLATFVQPDGKLTHVQPIGHSPVTFPSDSTAPYGVGALLLAGAEIHRLLQPGVATGP